LGDLIGSFNLACKELAGLTQQVALRYLIQQGVLIEELEVVGQDELAGFLYASASYGCIFVEANDHLVRRRFTVAHEIGHYLLHFRPLLESAERDQENLELTEVSFRGANDDLRDEISGRIERLDRLSMQTVFPPKRDYEFEANQFATELLLPENVIRGLFARAMLRFNDDDLVSYLASEMLVSLESMRWRLRQFHLLPLPARRIEQGK
jgi:Zn-dependent peptidase ImmA (M78 family)